MEEFLKLQAKLARKAAEKFVNRSIHFKYNEYRRTTLCGMCAIASVALAKSLQVNYNIEANIVIGCQNDNYIGRSHCWVEVNDYIIDVTATQFNLDAIIVASKEILDHYPYNEYNFHKIIPIKETPKVIQFFKEKEWHLHKQEPFLKNGKLRMRFA